MKRGLPVLAVALVVLFLDRDAAADQPPAVDPVAQAQGQALVDKTAHGRDAFRVDAVGTIIHIQSGMACPHGNEMLMIDRLVVTPGVPVGDNVACDYRAPSGKTTIFATRRGSQTLEAYAAGTFAAIRQIHPDVRPIGGQVSVGYPEISQPIGISFAITQNGSASITSAWIAQEGDWLILVRATYPAEPRHDPEFMAALAMMYAQLSVHRSAVK